MQEQRVIQAYDCAKERFMELGVDVEAAIEKTDAIPLSMQCWQGDDVIGFDGSGALSGGLATTGNYPGRARTAEELRGDMDLALKLIPGAKKVNLHACYAEKNGKAIDRDAYTVEQFSNWLSWAEERGLGLDFNPTFFSHPMMDGDFSLASPKQEVRRFWIEHGKRCREIGLAFASKLKQPCVVNFWMPDGFKDVAVNTALPRQRMMESLDEIFAVDIDQRLVPCALESKLFGVGVESYTVASHEFALGYAIQNKLLYCLDAGHFHPTEYISAKISAVLCSVERLLLHVSRGVRWDSDHVILLDDELQRIMDEVVWNGFEERVFIGLDYFDASINRIAAWVIGMRNARKAILSAALAPCKTLQTLEATGDLTGRLALLEDRKSLPWGAVWDYYCLKRGIAQDGEWLPQVKAYEADVLSKR